MKKIILVSSLILLPHLGYVHAMEQVPTPSADASNQSTAVVRAVGTESSAPLIVQMNIDTFRTIIRDTIHDVLGERLSADNEAMINIATITAARGVEREHSAQMQALAIQAQAQIERTSDTYEHRIADLQAQIAEISVQRDQAERERVLVSRISRVFIANPSLKAERIYERSADIMQIADLKTRHEAIRRLYDKFARFSDLFEQGGDLDILRRDVEYNQTNVIDKIPVKREHLPPHPLYAPNGWKPNQFDSLRQYFLAEYIDPIIEEIKAGITGIDTAHGGWGYWLTPHAASLFNEKIVGDINSHPNSRWEHDIETLKTRFLLNTGNLDNLIVEFNHFIELLLC